MFAHRLLEVDFKLAAENREAPGEDDISHDPSDKSVVKHGAHHHCQPSALKDESQYEEHQVVDEQKYCNDRDWNKSQMLGASVRRLTPFAVGL